MLSYDIVSMLSIIPSWLPLPLLRNHCFSLYADQSGEVPQL